MLPAKHAFVLGAMFINPDVRRGLVDHVITV